MGCHKHLYLILHTFISIELKKNISAINLDLAEIHSKLDYLNKRKLILQKEKKEMESEATLLERSCQLPDVDFKCSGKVLHVT